MVKLAVVNLFFFLILVLIYCAQRSESFKGDEDCSVWCDTKTSKRFREAQQCGVEYRYIPDRNCSPAQHEAIDIQLKGKCDYSHNSSDALLGIVISWSVSAQAIKTYPYITNFILEIRKGLSNSESGLDAEEIAIRIPKILYCNQTVDFKYFFHGVESEFQLDRDEGYIISVEAEPINECNPNATRIQESVRIPAYWENVEGCKIPNVSTTQTAPLIEDSSGTEITLITIGAILILITFISIFVVVTRTKRKTAEKGKNLLFLLNPGIADESLKERATTIATKLSDWKHVEEVQCNLWDTSSVDIIEWLQRRASWADVVIVMSVPNRTESNAESLKIFNNAILTVLKTETLQGNKRALVIHPEALDNHDECPIIGSGLYRRAIQIRGNSGEELRDNILKIIKRRTATDEAPLLQQV